MTVTTADRLAGVYKPKNLPSSKQRSLAGRYALPIQVLSVTAFTWAFLGWLNEAYLFWWDHPIWLNRYTEYAIILGFGMWRIVTGDIWGQYYGPNTRAASRMLIPSTWHARRTRPYKSTEYISRLSIRSSRIQRL